MEPPPVNDVVSRLNAVYFDAPAYAAVVRMFKEMAYLVGLENIIKKELTSDGTLTMLLDIDEINPFNLFPKSTGNTQRESEKLLIAALPDWAHKYDRTTYDFSLALFSVFMTGICKYYHLGVKVEYLVDEDAAPLKLICKKRPCLIQMRLGENRPEFITDEEIPEGYNKHLYAVFCYLCNIYNETYHEDRIKLFRYIHELTFEDVYSIQWSKEDENDSAGCIGNFEISG